MSIPIRVLLVEDNPSDAELLLHELCRGGFDPRSARVDNEADYLARLDPATDIILADYHMPQFGAMRALEILRERGLDIPVIVVSGTIGEELAVQALKEGATDYLLKDRLARLASTVKQAIRQRKLSVEKARAEEALRESEEKYRLLFECNPQPLWVCELERLSFLAVNEAAVRHYGYSREEFLSLTMRDIHAADASFFDELSGPAERTITTKHRKRDGKVIDVEVTSHEISFGGRPARLVLALDVTERKQLEEQFQQAQKMEAIGRLAGGVAHDFNNLLTAIIGYSQLALAEMDADDPKHKLVDEVRKAGERAAMLTGQLLAFSRRQVLQPRLLDLNEVIADVEKMLRRLIGEDIELVTSLDPGAGKVKADLGQMQQVIMNLVVNARDAMPSGGRLTIETARRYLDQQYAALHVGVEPGPYVLIAVSDTGCGMDEETRSLIFEPFFTTKEQGTGLGLSTVYGIVKQTSGHVWVYSEPGHGTTFKIYLPETGSAAAVSDKRSEAALAAGGSETVLLVEDEESVRHMVGDTLKKSGYKVLEAREGVEAIRLAESRPGPIHLLLTDVVVPGINGPELARRLSLDRPEMRILFISGYTDNAIINQGLLDKGALFLNKPFSPTALVSKVREALGR